MFYGDCSACASACAAAECACAFDSQGLYRSEGGEGALRQGLDLVVVERQQREILQVLEGVGANAVDLIGVQQPGEEGKRMEEGDVKSGGGRWREAACQSFSLHSFIMHSIEKTVHRYKVYFKGTTSSLSRSIQYMAVCACVCSAYSSCRA